MRIRILLILLFITQVCFATPLPAEKAFNLTATVRDPNSLQLQWTLSKGYYLYHNRIKAKSTTPEVVEIGNLRLPKGSFKNDPEFGRTEIYRNRLILSLPVLGQSHGQGHLKISYQGCADGGFCYPPIIQNITVTIDENRGLREAILESLPAEKKQAALPWIDGTALLNQHHVILSMLAFWFLGLLLAFTPCILPMVPVLSGIIVGHHQSLTTRKAFLLSLMYVLGMSITYAFVGVVIASLGANLQAAMQNPWVISLFASFFVLLAFSMFGFYELTLPTKIQAKFAALSSNNATGSYVGAALMGSLSTLILSPCVTPALVGVLGYVATSGNIWFGAIALFCLSIGMGTPLLCIGASANRLLPKAGYWMNAVKSALGFLLLAVAIHLLERILPGPFALLLWAPLFILLGLYLGALQRRHTYYGWLFQGVGIIFLFYGLICILGAALGHQDVTQPLVGLTQQSTINRISTPDELETEINKVQNKPILLDFYADWCTSCKVQDKHLFQDNDVKNALHAISVIRVDITRNDFAAQKLMKKYGVIAPPTLIWLDANKQLLSDNTHVGEVSKSEFLRTLALVLTH